MSRRTIAIGFIAICAGFSSAFAQTLEETLRQMPAAEVASLARTEGDSIRGAIVFFQPQMACSKCHAVGKTAANVLGPDLTTLGKDVTDEALIESVLWPSKTIRNGYQSVTLTTNDGKSLAALLVEQTPQHVVVRDLARGGELMTFAKSDIEDLVVNTTSIMPSGQVHQLNSRQQFLDLIRYLIEIRDGGAIRAVQLQPAASLLAVAVPEYEKHIDHAGLISQWNQESFKRGEAIYQRVCENCHGTKDKAGSLPTSLRFAQGKFKNGSDPLSMYRTLTHGFGLMAPQTWMVPSQKYDVIHYLREAYLKPHNSLQFVTIDEDYLKKLPAGTSRGPEPSQIVPWSAMNYGQNLAHTYEIPGIDHNIAYKGIAVRLDNGPGGISRGQHWTIFDSDTMRVAAGWTGSGKSDENFIDWKSIQFNGAHGVHPRIVGKTAFVNSTGPGWANPANGTFSDDQRVLGRDGRQYGPLPREWAAFRGLYHHGQHIIQSYTVGTTDVLESSGYLDREQTSMVPVFTRTFNVGPRNHELLLQVAQHPSHDKPSSLTSTVNKPAIAVEVAKAAPEAQTESPFLFDGQTYLEIPQGDLFDVTQNDFTVSARIKTKHDGTLWSVCKPGTQWTAEGHCFFIRNGKLVYDIGWVGAMTGQSRIDDDRWHTVAVTWKKSDQLLKLYVDGKPDGEKRLASRTALDPRVIRIGFATSDFPRRATFFQGQMSELRFHQQVLTDSLNDISTPPTTDANLVGRWQFAEPSGPKTSDEKAIVSSNPLLNPVIHREQSPAETSQTAIVAGVAPANTPVEWLHQQGNLRLRIPAGQQPLRFTIWIAADSVTGKLLNSSLPQIPDADRDLSLLTRGGPQQWSQILETQTIQGNEEGPFATDVLSSPESNPWLAQTRFTGLDFLSDGRIAVCTWDGDVWLVSEVPPINPPAGLPTSRTLRWQRIASGMFQPLGLKVINDKIHVTCRDQLTVLHDLNGDQEIDFYQCLNNDHQVTEHFHEFAMGLQTDAQGNFYYAKSGCHGKPAVVPHHGTLLRISRDGLQTEILANGFRAANGVCLNPDGSFVVTDQEGFWNPKNRINWVTVDPSQPPGFYGNMLGYHNVSDTSDAAMVPPLCWITNAFDRSPGELLWVESDRWGPLNGALLNLSYGYGKVFIVPHEKVGSKMQGGMIELPIPSFPTGVMRGRFQPANGDLYLCGMFAWAGNATHPGGLYRLRATGRPVELPVGLSATKSGLKLTFTEPLDAKSLNVDHFQIKTWSLKRTAKYGSQHFDEKTLAVRNATLSVDGKILTIDVADLSPTWCMEITYLLTTATGRTVSGKIHNTIHELAD